MQWNYICNNTKRKHLLLALLIYTTLAKWNHLGHMPETQKLNVISECKQSVATSWHFLAQNALDIFNARHVNTTLNLQKNLWYATMQTWDDQLTSSTKSYIHVHISHKLYLIVPFLHNQHLSEYSLIHSLLNKDTQIVNHHHCHC